MSKTRTAKKPAPARGGDKMAPTYQDALTNRCKKRFLQ